MEDSLQISLFAHDLMNYIMRLNDSTIQLPIDENMRRAMGDNSPFNRIIGLAVGMLTDNNMVLIEEEYKKVREFEFELSIGRWAMQRVVSFCPDGYEPKNFLLYTSLIVGIASIYSRHGRVGIVMLLTEIYASVLTSYVMTTEFKYERGFERLTTEAESLIEILEGNYPDSDESTETEETAQPTKSEDTENSEIAPPNNPEATEKAATDTPSKSKATKNAKNSGKRKGTGKKKGRKHK